MDVIFAYVYCESDMDMLTDKTRQELELYLVGIREKIAELQKKEHAVLELLEQALPAIVADQRPSPARWGSVRKSVYEATIALLREKRKPVKSNDILHFMQRRKMDLGKSKEPERNILSHLNAIISGWDECVLTRSGWGEFDFKPELKDKLLREPDKE